MCSAFEHNYMLPTFLTAKVHTSLRAYRRTRNRLVVALRVTRVTSDAAAAERELVFLKLVPVQRGYTYTL